MRSQHVVYAQGYKQGYQHGYNRGYVDGYNAGAEQALIYRDEGGCFAGTSIIIPTYNKRAYVQQCIESIVAHTDVPYEVIVVDNGSTDDTVPFLQTLTGRIRLILNKHNRGFAQAVNQGLQAAQGTTMVILNNDAIVTERWLRQLLYCIHSSENYGIAAPVTNYISGEQLIEVQYGSVDDMHIFARNYNHSNPARWTETARLTGFCMIMRRDVFERLGYLDEGFEVGNCEDDDYSMRVKLLGFKLIIARDTFIHHYGSVSMKELQADFTPIYENNLQYFSRKWQDPGSVLAMSERYTQSGTVNTVDYYPTHIVVGDGFGNICWIEPDGRYEIDHDTGMQTVRVSAKDMQQWPLLGTLTNQQCLEKIELVRQAQLTGTIVDGVVIQCREERYQILAGHMRHIASDYAYNTWFEQRGIPCLNMNDEHIYPLDRPIVAPIVIKADSVTL